MPKQAKRGKSPTKKASKKKKSAPPKKKVLEPEVLTEAEAPATSGSAYAADASGPVIDGVTGATIPASVGSDPAKAGSRPTRSVPAKRAVTSGSALDMFMAQVGRFPVLSAPEEKALAVEVFERGDPVAAKKLVVHNLRLVVKMAYKYRRAWASVLDLIQEGNIGLVEAVNRFDPFRGARFSTYASYWIRAYMIRYLLDHSRMVKIARTRAGRKLFFRLNKERAKLRALGMEAGPKLLAERLGVSEKDYKEVAMHMDQAEVRLDAPISYQTDGGGTILDTIDASGPSPESMAHQKAFAEDVGEALDSFAATLKDEREKAAWEEHLMSPDPISLSELGERFGVTKQRMGQIVNAIRKRLKVHLTEELGPDVELDYRGF